MENTDRRTHKLTFSLLCIRFAIVGHGFVKRGGNVTGLIKFVNRACQLMILLLLCSAHRIPWVCLSVRFLFSYF